MITIHDELTIEPGDFSGAPITLWLVDYEGRKRAELHPEWPRILAYLKRVCALQGWLLECGDDPYRERSLGNLVPGFGRYRDDDGAW